MIIGEQAFRLKKTRVRGLQHRQRKATGADGALRGQFLFDSSQLSLEGLVDQSELRCDPASTK